MTETNGELGEDRVMMFIELVIFAVGHGQLPTDGKRDQILMNINIIYRTLLFPERLHGETNFHNQRHSLSSFFWNQST